MAHNDTSIPQPTVLRNLNLVVHCGFALTGVVTTLTGAILPVLSSRWSLDDTQAGYLLAAQSVGGLSSTLCVGELMKRLGIKRSLVLAFTLMTLGIAGINANAFDIGLISVLGYGLGLGIAIPTSNILIAQINPERRAAALNVLNLVWCLGAVIGTPLISYCALKVNTKVPLLSLTVALALIAAGLSQLTFQRAAAPGKEINDSSGNGITVIQSRLALCLCVFVFLIVGIENSLSGWIASYVARLDTSQLAFASLYQAAFWGSMLLGRAAAPTILKRVAEPRLVLIGVSLCFCGTLLILTSATMVFVLLGVLLAGLGLSSVFPTTIAIFSQVLGSQAARQSSWLFASGSLGSSTMPFLVGLVSARFASLRIGLTIPLLAAFLAIALQVNIAILIKALARRPSE